MFQVDDAWELTNERDILRLLFNQPGLRRHPLVEVVDNPPIFHLDVMFTGEAEELGFWARFLGADLATVVRFIEENEIAQSRISVQTAISHTNEYRIQRVGKIYECHRPDGITYFQYESVDDVSIIDSSNASGAQTGDMKRVIWSALS